MIHRNASRSSAGIPTVGGIGVTSDSTDRAPSGRVAPLGRVVLIVAPAGQEDRVKGWTAGLTRTIEKPTGWGLASCDLLNSLPPLHLRHDC